MSDSVVVVERADPASAEARALLQAMWEELAPLYGLTGAGPTVPAGVLAEGGAFVIARRGGEAVGCGALYGVEPGLCEVKRMYVARAARGSGVARRIVDGLERIARELGYARVRLETGTLQPAAIRLYDSAGYHRTEGYGAFVGDPLSVCFEKLL